VGLPSVSDVPIDGSGVDGIGDLLNQLGTTTPAAPSDTYTPAQPQRIQF